MIELNHSDSAELKRARWRAAAIGIVVALVGVGAMTMVRWFLDPWLGIRALYLFYFPVILFVSLRFGLGPALTSLAASFAAKRFFLDARLTGSREENLAEFLLVVVGLLLVGMCQAHRRSRERASEGERRLRAELDSRDRIERARLESERRVGKLTDDAPMLMWVTGADGIVTYMNKAWLDFRGRKFEEEIGNGWAEGLHPDDLQPCVDSFQTAVKQHAPYVAEFRLKRHDGEFRWFLTQGVARFAPDGGYAGHIGSCLDITERKHAEQRLRLMMLELDHRVKNNLATVASLAEQTIHVAGSLSEFGDSFLGRIRAMARMHGAIAESHWRGVGLEQVVRSAMEAYVIDGHAVIEERCPEVFVSPKAANLLSMVLHELATNAVKYGALSRSTGRATVGWVVSGENVELRWTERGGPTVTPPEREGFGTTLIRDGVRFELRGTVRVQYQPEGLECDIVIPLAALSESMTQGALALESAA